MRKNLASNIHLALFFPRVRSFSPGLFCLVGHQGGRGSFGHGDEVVLRLNFGVGVLQLIQDFDADGLVGALGCSDGAAIGCLILLQTHISHIEFLFLINLGLFVRRDLLQEGDLLVVGVLDLEAAEPLYREGLVVAAQTSFEDVLDNEEGRHVQDGQDDAAVDDEGVGAEEEPEVDDPDPLAQVDYAQELKEAEMQSLLPLPPLVHL